MDDLCLRVTTLCVDQSGSDKLQTSTDILVGDNGTDPIHFETFSRGRLFHRSGIMHNYC